MSTSCSPGDPQPIYVTPSVSTTSQCSTANLLTGTVARAYSQVYFTEATQAGDWNALHISLYAVGDHNYSLGLPDASIQDSNATAFASYLAFFLPSGPVRQGYLQFLAEGGADHPYSGITHGSASLTTIDGSYAANLFCNGGGSGTCSGNQPEFTNHALVPYTLGTAFSLNGAADSQQYVSRNVGESGGAVNITYQFRFFEADGVTPVAVTELPEPSSFLMVPAFLAVLFWKKRLLS